MAATRGDRQRAATLFDESLLYFRKVADTVGIEQAVRQREQVTTKEQHCA